MGDQRVLHGARGEERAEHITGASNLASAPARPEPTGASPAPADRRRGTSPTMLHHDAGQAGHEGEPDPDRPQVGVEHQQTGSARVAFTRVGYLAL